MVYFYINSVKDYFLEYDKTYYTRSKRKRNYRLY